MLLLLLLPGRSAAALPFYAADFRRLLRLALRFRSGIPFHMSLLPPTGRLVLTALGLIFTFNALRFPPYVSATAVNITVDDSNTTWFNYQPPDVWSSNSNCSSCLINDRILDPTQTWHDATARGPDPVNVSFSFTGE
jgi:hypothetical protein